MSQAGTDEAELHGIRRSPHWPTVEHHFKAANPFCMACGKDAPITLAEIQVHHRIPFHFCILLGRPDLETDFRNLVGLCETEAGPALPNHHLLLGHLDDFKSYNVDVLEDASVDFYQKTAQEIIASKTWVQKHTNKPKAWADMTDEDKKALRELMDSWYPKL